MVGPNYQVGLKNLGPPQEKPYRQVGSIHQLLCYFLLFLCGNVVGSSIIGKSRDVHIGLIFLPVSLFILLLPNFLM
jgi:hypothetical protein